MTHARLLRIAAMFAALALPLSPVHADPAAWPPGRLVLDPARRPLPTVADARALAAHATQVVPVPLPAGAVQLDSTWYDLQDMGSLGHRIEVGPDGRVHVTWQDEFCELGGGCPPNLSAPQPYPNRGMGYAVRDAAGNWTNQGKVRDLLMPTCCLRDLAGGFGSLAIAPTGRIALAQHLNEDGCDLRGYFHLQDSPGASTWTAYVSPIVSPSYLFPQVAASTNGSYTVLGEVPQGGVYGGVNDMGITWLQTPGTRYTCFNYQTTTWVSLLALATFHNNKPGFPCLAAASDGRVGVAVTDPGGNVYLVESSNGSFATGTVTVRTILSNSDATITQSDSTSTQYRPYLHCHIAYADTTPHIVWSELQARKSGSTFHYVDWRSRIRHWDSKTGITTVYQVPAGLADHYDDLSLGLNGPIAGFNTSSVDWPQVGFSTDGSEWYVAFIQCTDAEIDPTANAGLPGIITGVGFGDIVCSVGRTGQAWSAPQNLTNTPQTDERFFSLSTRNPHSRAHIVLQASATNQAGCVVIGDRGTSPGNIVRRVAYLEVPLTASVLAVGPPDAAPRAPLRVSPNPAFGATRVRFAAAPWPAPRGLIVTDVLGRSIATLELPANATGAEWSGRTVDGRLAPAGVYFVTLREAPAEHAVRFVLAH